MNYEFYIGYKIYKPVADDAEYAAAADWCNEHGATIEDKGDYYEVCEIVVPPPTKEKLNEWAFKQKCAVAYTGVYVTRAGIEYLLETDKESISMINAVISSGVSQINWKVYKDEVPCLLALTQAQFQEIFAFAFSMINEAFTVEGDANEQVSVMTDEQLRDEEYISAFKDTFTGRFAQIDKTISIDESNSGAEQ